MPGLTRGAVENVRGFAVGTPNRSACGGEPQVGSKDFGKITGGRRFNRDHRTGNRAAGEREKVRQLLTHYSIDRASAS